jgi:hypothetical protein
MSPSKWELFLIAIHVVIIVLEVGYYASRWDDLPAIISYCSEKGIKRSKYNHVYAQAFNSLPHTIFGIFGSYYIPKTGYLRGWDGPSLSHDMAKAAKQYRVEISNLLCMSVMTKLFFLVNGVLNTENQIKLGMALCNPTALLQIIIVIITCWLVHHMLWTKLSDKY